MQAVFLFDIDGTLLRRSGPHHREALVSAVRGILNVDATIDGIPVQGMLDRDILKEMVLRAGLSASAARRVMPELARRAQYLYSRSCPDSLEDKVCPGVPEFLAGLGRTVPKGLVTGNLSRIGWKKMERAGLRRHFRFGAFAEQGPTRAALVRLAIGHARAQGWIGKRTPIWLVGDHPNDILAARANRISSLAVGTGVVSMDDLARHRPSILVEDLTRVDPRTLLERSCP